MQPREIVRATTFGPAELKVVFTAFDDAWSEIAPRIVAESSGAVASARASLATIVLGLAASAEPTTADGLKALAMAVFRAKHRLAEAGTG